MIRNKFVPGGIMSRFRKIKRKKVKIPKKEHLELINQATVIALVEKYRDRSLPEKVSIDRAYDELIEAGVLKVCKR